MRFLPILFALPIFLLSYSLTLHSYSFISPRPAYAQTVTIAATIEAHLTWREVNGKLIISTNLDDGFVLTSNEGIITKNGPIELAIPKPAAFTLTSGL